MAHFPQLSIIIPVYNAESYVSLCLDSIIRQRFENYEIIIVDDGSTDNSYKICNEYKSKAEDMRIFRQENKGVSAARNLGINKSRGEWLYFVDADDQLDEDCLRTFWEGVGDTVSLIMGGYRKITMKGELISPANSAIRKIISINEAIKELYEPSDFPYQGYLWSKLFRADIIREFNLKFNESISFNEDRLFVLQYLTRTKGSVHYMTKPVYNYYERASGAMASINNSYNRKFSTDFLSYVLMKREIYSFTKDKRLRQLSLGGIISSYMSNIQLMIRYSDYDMKIHWTMVWLMLKEGAMRSYLRKYHSLLLLLYPQFIIKRKKK